MKPVLPLMVLLSGLAGAEDLCLRCMKEKRIPQREVALRLMERDGKDIFQTVGEELHYIETDHFKLVINLPGQNMKLAFDPKVRAEMQLLHVLFPSVSENTTTLSDHHIAHLIANRLKRTWSEVQELLGVTDADFAAPYIHLGQKGKYELYLFRNKKNYDVFCDRFTGRAHTFAQEWTNREDDSLAIICYFGAETYSIRDFWNQVVHSWSHTLLQGYRHFSFKLPAWLHEGFGHTFERKEYDGFNSFCYDEGGRAQFWEGKKWKQRLKKMVASGKVSPFPAYYQKIEVGELLPEEHGQCWSLVSWLIETDPKKFRAFVNLIKARKTQDEALQQVYGWSVLQLDEAWRAYVLKTYPSN